MKNKLRILMYLNILRDGAGMINREVGFAEELANRGHDVTILSHFKATKKVTKNVTVRTIFNTSYIHWFYDKPFGAIKTQAAFKKAISEVKPHVVMVDLPQEAKWALKFRSKFKYRILFTYHGVANSKYYSGKVAAGLDQLRQFGHDMLRQVDQVVVVSDFLQGETESISVEAKTIHNGVDRSLFSSTKKFNNILHTKPVVLFIGRYTPYKGAINVVKAFAKVSKNVPDAELVMRGYYEDQSYFDQMKAIVSENKIKDRVHFLGSLDGAEMPYWMNMASVFANGSDDETFCMPLLEAQSCKTPCVGIRAGGVPEVVKHYETGLLADSGDIDTFAANMEQLLTDNGLSSKLSAAADKHADSFTYPHLTDQLEPVLIELAKRGRN